MKYLRTLILLISASIIVRILTGAAIFFSDHHKLSTYANEQKHLLIDSIHTLNDSLNIYREYFYESID